MKTTMKNALTLLGGMLLLGSCNHQPQLTNRVYTFQADDKLVALQLFDEGKAALSEFRHLKNKEEESVYIWDGQNIDTLSYRIKENRLSLWQRGEEIGFTDLENNLSFDLSVPIKDGKFAHLIFQHDKRFTTFDSKNKYVGKAYQCSTLSDNGIELIFVTADRVIARPAEGFIEKVNDYQLGEYEIMEDGCLLVKLKGNRFELEPDKENLKFNTIGESYTFRKNKYQPTLWDALEAEVIHREAKAEFHRRDMEYIREYGNY